MRRKGKDPVWEGFQLNPLAELECHLPFLVKKDRIPTGGRGNTRTKGIAKSRSSVTRGSRRRKR